MQGVHEGKLAQQGQACTLVECAFIKHEDVALRSKQCSPQAGSTPSGTHPQRRQQSLLKILGQCQQACGWRQPRLCVRCQQHGKSQPILEARPQLLGARPPPDRR